MNDRNPVCQHHDLVLLNPFEVIRKYQCSACSEVMMCECDARYGKRFAPHQLTHARIGETNDKIPVTIGFLKDVCNTCRGQPETPAPKRGHYGATSKIMRYYWREHYVECQLRFGDWCDERGFDLKTARREYPGVRSRISTEVWNELKALHSRAPKYIYSEESSDDLLRRCQVEVLNLDGIYIARAGRDRPLLHGAERVSPEEFVSRHLRDQGYSVMPLESRPFHALFGVFMWLWVQDARDNARCRVVCFGNRDDFDAGIHRGRDGWVWTHLPDDFGLVGHAERRRKSLIDHLRTLREDRNELLWLFDYWSSPGYSTGLCQYLWAHRHDDVVRARRLVEILPPTTIKLILQYLAEGYWGRYLGWPDLLAFKPEMFVMVEVKSSKDTLGEDQKRWIRDNHSILGLPFQLVKIHRRATVDASHSNEYQD